MPRKDLHQILQERAALAASRGFTLEYQNQQERKENNIAFRELAPATHDKYDRAVETWILWRLSRGEPGELETMKEEPVPTPQAMKLFAEYYIVTRRKDLPSTDTVCGHFINFTSFWERTTSREIPMGLKKDVLNYIRTELKRKYNLRTKPREQFLVTAKDIEYLLRRLFVDDTHEYLHERARVQTGASLALFAGSGARAGAIVESSAYRHSNQAMYYKHLTFHLKWGREPGTIKRWVTIDPEFLKGCRFQDNTKAPKSWFREHDILGFNFVFWVIVHGIADGAFKGISTIEELLAKRPPKGRESWTLHWREEAQNVPFFRMVTSEGPKKDRALTFSSLRHNNTSLARRDGYKNTLRVHGIRGAVANRIDARASEATRGQALDHQNPDTYLKYQSTIKALDVQALFWDLEQDYECRDMEQSMAHHRDPNAPVYLDAAAQEEFSRWDKVVAIDAQIAHLTEQIDRRPKDHSSLAAQRTKLHSQKANLREAYRSSFISKWWEDSYDEYMAGNELKERDRTCLFDILQKYLPERARLRDNLFKKASLDSDAGKQCLRDMVSLCVGTENVVYYPGLRPENDKCPYCSKDILSITKSSRAKHILQCRRKSLDSAPYQQRYRSGKRAHRRIRRKFLQFCYLCTDFFHHENDWTEHCQWHLVHLTPRCGLLTFRYTLVAPGFCPFCLGDNSKSPDERFQQWLTKATLMHHINVHLGETNATTGLRCPHPLCGERDYGKKNILRYHLFDGHSIEEPRPNCITLKRKLGTHLESENDEEQENKSRKL